jgi:hypothetical protein
MKRRSLLRLLLSWFRDAASRARAKQLGDRLIFPVVMPARIFWALGAAIYGSVAAVLLLASEHSAWIQLCLLIFAIWIFSYWPWTVTLDRNGISKRNYFGMKKLLRWSEVIRLRYRERFEDYVAVSREGRIIWFSSFHVDPARFEAEVLKNSLLKDAEVTDPALDPYSSRKRPLI